MGCSMKIKNCFQNLFYGFLIGVAMLIPGVSGGTIAVLLGIYDDLLSAVANLFKRFFANFFFISSVGIGGLIGFVSMAGIVENLLNTAKFTTTYFFIGIIVGSLLVMFSKYKTTNFVIKLPMLMLGAAVVMLLKFIPNNLIIYEGVSLWIRFAIIIVAGLMLGGALILPGISFSMTLMTLGLYEVFLLSVNEFNIHVLLPIIFSTMFGAIVLSKILSICLSKHTDACQSMIIGFVIASLFEIFPGIPRGFSLLWSLLLMLFGILISVGLALWTNKKRA